MKKRVLALLLAGAAVASLAACGSSDSGASGSGSAAGGDGEVVELVLSLIHILISLLVLQSAFQHIPVLSEDSWLDHTQFTFCK